jgi:hypothetical protein
MKKLAYLILNSVFFISCGENKTVEPAPSVVEEPQAVVKVDYPFEAKLANDWTIGDAQHTVKVLELYKLLQTADFADSLVLPYFADSITSVSFDDRVYAGNPRGFLKRVRDFKGQFKEFDEEFVSYVCLHSERKGIDMVSLWFKESGTRKNGKVDSTRYQENWIFNKEGKITARTAFARYGF